MPMLTRLNDILKENSEYKEPYERQTYLITIDIIVPIYNGFEFLTELLKSIQRTNVSYRLILINDCSTDQRVSSLLTNYKLNHENVIVLTNSNNEGYIKSINKALLYTTNHVVLLNSDVLLPEEWLERLIQPILKNNKIATVTPFTNAGSICSFPIMDEDNALFDGMSLEEMDCIFKKQKPCYYPIPTGVGFCMALNQRALNDIGTYDEKNLVDAYGEENDWCERATRCGYQHVIADNLFVYHKHHGSYGKEKGVSLRNHNSAILSKKYPGYAKKISSFYKSIPYSKRVKLLCMQCAMYAAKGNTYLIVNHDLIGGSADFMKAKKEALLEKKAVVFELIYRKNQYELSFFYQTIAYTFVLSNMGSLQVLFQMMPCSYVLINSLVHYKYLQTMLHTVIELKKKVLFQLIYYVHDYFCICPSVHFLTRTTCYCGYVEQKNCNACNEVAQSLTAYGYRDIKKYRKDFEVFFQYCDDIIVFSNDSKRILEQTFPTIHSIYVKPHMVDYVKPVVKKEKKEIFVIGVLGNISKEKGSQLIHQLGRIIEQEKLPIRIVVIGVLHPNRKLSCIDVYGPYKKEEITKIAEEKGIDLFFIPSIVPETFSFTTEEAMHTELPVAVFNLGAPAERVKNYEHGIVIEQQSADAVLSMIQSIQSKGVEN